VFYATSYNARYVVAGQTTAAFGAPVLSQAIYQSHRASSYRANKPAFANGLFAPGKPQKGSAHPKSLSVPKAVCVANAFDAHNTAFAKPYDLEALGAEGVFYGSYLPL
jgi:hypothetical protein